MLTTSCMHLLTNCVDIVFQELQQRGASIVTIPRGGETTFHGPGQLIAYPIVDLRQLRVGARAYVEGLEDAMIRTLGCFGLQVGVWTVRCSTVRCSSLLNA